ncbi:HoxN/HupN/NixA family nickel/cobalt transporter [Caulobacter sp. S45]|uniref:HoxN/HupN/NixA family nickel/cobalt transporter n=1 Tax=Caulobacter sp. S45 TaxID=1641861 RepID=UPI00131B37AF|nr:HoxN/HupN/NixA family nickel/cobalt transporter [Caulobacter sp. S45]
MTGLHIDIDLGRDAAANRRATWLLAALALANLAAWGWAWSAFHGRPAMLGLAMLAYTFGLRHALDADHIAAIDNVTRKFVQEGRRPVGVGFFFSIGHSTVVVAACICIALASTTVQAHLGALQTFGAVAGALVSASFLFTVATANLGALFGGGRRRTSGHHHDDLQPRGLLGRLIQPVLGFVSSSWRMAPVGLLFGLGFDTASEVGLLGLSAAHASGSTPISSIMVFPALFAAGMSLLDSIDSVMMLKAYAWALVKPKRKLYYNRTVTALSVLLAFGVGLIELLDLLRSRVELGGRFWRLVGQLSDHTEIMGAAIVAVFALLWGAAALLAKVQNGKESSI